MPVLSVINFLEIIWEGLWSMAGSAPKSSVIPPTNSDE